MKRLFVVVTAAVLLAALAVSFLYRPSEPDIGQPLNVGAGKPPPPVAPQPDPPTPKLPTAVGVQVETEQGSRKPPKPGSLTKEAIRRVILRSINAVRVCYEQALSRNPSMKTELVLKFTIGASGKVIEASVEESQTEDAQVDACVLAVAQAWVFPPPEGGGVVKVTYPFHADMAGG